MSALRLAAAACLATTFLHAQQPAAPAYYHPDDLASLSCDVKVDFTQLVRQLGTASLDPKTLTGAKLHVAAARTGQPKVEMVWPEGAKLERDRVEEAIQQGLDSFFQFYWRFFAVSVMPREGEQVQVRPVADGGQILLTNSDGAAVGVAIDRNGLPQRMQINAEGIVTMLTFRFSAAGQENLPVALDFVQRIEGNDAGGRMTVDHQTVDGIHIPAHITFGTQGLAPLAAEFTACAVTKTK